MRRHLLPLALLALVAASCGSDDDSSDAGGSTTTADIERTTEEQVPAAAIRDAIAASFSAGGAVTEEQAQCLAQSIVDSMGLQALNDVGAGADFSNASPEVQQQLVEAVSDAAAACDVPLSQLGG
jgi:hypothetical protein